MDILNLTNHRGMSCTRFIMSSPHTSKLSGLSHFSYPKMEILSLVILFSWVSSTSFFDPFTILSGKNRLNKLFDETCSVLGHPLNSAEVEYEKGMMRKLSSLMDTDRQHWTAQWQAASSAVCEGQILKVTPSRCCQTYINTAPNRPLTPKMTNLLM